MIPRQFKALLDALRLDLHSIKGAIDEQTSTLSGQREFQDRLAGEISAKLEALRVSEREKNERIRRDRVNQRWNKALVVGTWAAFIAAAYYGWIAKGQLREMKDATNAAISSAKLANESAAITKQVTEANYEAICNVRTETDLPDDSEMTTITNSGN